MTRLFLAVSALAWAGFGLFCFLNPTFLAGEAGVAATSTTGTIELQAMYGGLQMALGVLAAVAVFKPWLQRPVLVVLASVTTGLFGARLLGALMVGEFSSYTIGGLVFEAVLSLLAALLARKAVR